MFIVQPVRSPEYQKELAEQLGGKMHDGAFAFCATEMEDDLTTVKYPIAVCQFTFTTEKAVIKSLDIRSGSEKDEAVTILVRTVMNWVYRADVPFIEFDEGAADEEYIKSVSFCRNAEGRYSIDLKLFYKSPCHYGK